MKQNIIYLRTSTTEQTPELQLNGCKEVVSKLNLREDDYDIVEEQKSAFKNDDKREVFNNIIKEIKRSNVKVIIVWDLDRLYRNRKKLVSFFEVCKMFKCRIYSLRQNWLEDVYKAPEPWNEIIFSMLLNVMGWMAQDESEKKSDRIKNAVRKEDGKQTESYKGNKWGRKEVFNNKRLTEDVLKLKKDNPTLSIKDISKQTYYYDRSKNKKNPSTFVVWKILRNNNIIEVK